MSLLDLLDDEEVEAPKMVPANAEADFDSMLTSLDTPQVTEPVTGYGAQPALTLSAKAPNLLDTPTTEQQAYDPISGKKNLPYPSDSSSLKELALNRLEAGERHVGDISSDDTNLMSTFNDVVNSKKYDNYDDQLNAVANAGYNPARIRQLTEPKHNSSSPYWDEYGLSHDIDMIENGWKKLWYGGKDLFSDLDAEDKATLEEARASSKSIKGASSSMAYVVELAPEMVISYPMLTVKAGAGTVNIISKALANATVQGGITAAAIQGETGDKAQALGWGTAVSTITGVIGFMPLLGGRVDSLAMKFINERANTQQMREYEMALDVVEDTKNLTPTQKKLVAFAKMDPEGSRALEQVVSSSPEARQAFIETIMKKEASSDIGIKRTPHEQWSEIFNNVVKEEEAMYVHTQKAITQNLGKLKVPATELGIDMRHLEFDESLTSKWLPMDSQTLSKMKKGKSVSLEELQSFRRAAAQQGMMLNEEGAKQLGSQFVKLSKDIDNFAIPKVLESGALPKEALIIAEEYQKSIKGYAAMNNAIRSSIGKKVLTKATEEELQKAVRTASLRKGIDLTSESEDFVQAIKQINPKAVPIVEQTILKDIVQASKSPISKTNKAVAIDWAQVARDLDKFSLDSFTSQEGKSSFVVMKKIANVSQTDNAILKSAFHAVPTSELAQMGRSALGFNTTLIAMKKAVTEATKYFHSPTAFVHSLEKAMEVKGSNLSEVLFSMQSVGIVPKGTASNKAFNQAVKELGKIQADINEARNMKFLGYAGEGSISVDGKQFNNVGDLIDAGMLKVNEGDNIAVNMQGKTAMVLSDDVSITNIGELARGKTMRLEDVLDAPKLYEEHPHLKNILLQPFEDSFKDGGIRLGAADVDKGVIHLNMNKQALTRDFVGTLMHEVGHNVNQIMGVPPATTTDNLKRIVAEKYGGNIDNFLDDVGAPNSDVSLHQVYQAQIDEQFSDMNLKKRNGNVNFSAMGMSEDISKMVDDLADERMFLKGKGFSERAVEEMVPATPIEITQKIDRLMGSLNDKQRMAPKQLVGWLEKQGVNPREIQNLELQALDNQNVSRTIGEYREYIKQGGEKQKIQKTTTGVEDETFMYTDISYKGGGYDDPKFQVHSQSIDTPEITNPDDLPGTHQFSGYLEGGAEIGHRRTGVQKINGEDATILHEIQSDWQQQSRQMKKPFKRDVDEFIKKEKEHADLMDKYYSDASMNDLEHDKLEELQTWMKENGELGNHVERVSKEGVIHETPVNRGIVNPPTTTKKYTQWQVAETINQAIENGTNKVIIPIDREGALQGHAGITKAYENMERPIREMVKKLEKQGMNIEFKRTIDKVPTTYSKTEKIEKGKIGIEIADNLESVVLSNGEDVEVIADIIDEVTTVPNSPAEFKQILESSYKKFESKLIDEFGFSKREAKEQMDLLYEDLDPSRLVDKDQRVYEINILGKEKGSKQSWDMMSILGAIGLSEYTTKESNEVK